MADTQILEQCGIPDAPVTMEQFLEWQEEDIHAEWVDGKVILMSPSSRKHQEVSVFLTTLIQIFSETRHLGVLLNAPFSMRLTARPSVREPDLLFICTEHLDRLKDTYLDGPADFVVEIVSPDSIGRDRGEKFAEYEQAGIPEYWLIDPIREQAEFYRLNDRGRYQAIAPEKGIYHSSILPGFWLKPGWFWQDPLPRVLDVLRELDIH